MDPNPPLGSVGFSASGSFVSGAIRWFTRSDWSHTFLVAGQIGGVPVVLEASWDAVRIHRLDEYAARGYRLSFFAPRSVEPIGIQFGLAAAMEKLDVRYGYLQVLGFASVILWRRLTGRMVPNPARGGQICSELVLRYLRSADPDGHWWSMDRDATSPEDLHAALVKSKAFRPVPINQ